MPIGEEYSSRLVVSVGGSPLAPAVLAQLESAYVDDSVHVPSMTVLRFSDERHSVLEDLGVQIGDPVTVAVQQSGQGGPVDLFDGDVTALEQEIDEWGIFTTVRALDVRHLLQSGASVGAFTTQSVNDVVTSVVRARGLQAQVTDFQTKADHLARDGESDWELLCRLARQVGAAIWVEGRTVCFARPVEASTAPGGTDARSDPLVIARGQNLMSLRATLTGTGQVPAVSARAWDPVAKRAVTASGEVAAVGSALQTTPSALAAKVGGVAHVVGTSRVQTHAGAEELAATTAAARAGGFAEVEGVVRGNPALRAATAVHLVDVGPQFAGKYVLTSVRHTVDPHDGYRTSFGAADVSDRSVYGVLAGGTGATGSRGRVLPAVVSNVKDPDQLGRVKVSLPAVAEQYESWWARPVQVGAGKDRGTAWLPEVDDEVLVIFGDGLDEPYVLGGLYNGKDTAARGWAAHVDGTGKVSRRALTSRQGMVLEFVEDGSTETLTVSTNDGAQHLTLTQTAQKGVVLVSQGALEVTAEQDITVTGKRNISVTTATGDLTLKGANVTIEATAALTLEGAQVTAKAQGPAELSGAAVKVSASGMAELSASGVTTVRGSLVKIN